MISKNKSKKLKTGLEKDFKKQVINALKQVPNIYFFVKEAVAIRGIPDIVGCTAEGRFFAFELKRSRNCAYYKGTFEIKPGRSKLQGHNIDKINTCNGIACFLYPDNFHEKITSIFYQKSQKNPLH